MSISAISGGASSSYFSIASGKRINSAADDASGLAISQKMQREENGLSVGADNGKDGIGFLNVADGALDGVMDYLQRIRELSVQSMHGLYTDSDRATFQTEISQLKEGIQSLAQGTTLNEQKLLDGSMADLHLATNPDGSGMKIQMANATLEALGIADYDVTSGNFDLGAIDKAMQMVSDARSNLGSSTNRLEHAYNYNTSASLEQLSSRSRLEDLDMPQAISKQKQEDLLKEYRTMMLKKQMEQDSLVTRLFR